MEEILVESNGKRSKRFMQPNVCNGDCFVYDLIVVDLNVLLSYYSIFFVMDHFKQDGVVR